nr:cyclic nucleotide-binding domain-containing protein [Halorhodospira halochloris]
MVRKIQPDQPDRVLQILDRLAFFHEFSPLERHQLAETKDITVLAEAGENIIQRGQQGKCFYILLHGRAEVLGDGDTPPCFRELGSGDVFGEIGFLADIARTAHVRCTERSILFRFSRPALDVQPIGIREKIKDQLLANLARRLEELNSRLEGNPLEQNAP